MTVPVFAVVPMLSAPFAKPLSMPNVPLVGPVMVAPSTERVPPTVVFPVSAVTMNLFVFTVRSLVTPRVPATVVLPLAAVTLNLLVFTEKFPVTPRV
ncbi:MAG: hypothetical protein E6I83_02050, partial [Chloroflexi bacterium]